MRICSRIIPLIFQLFPPSTQKELSTFVDLAAEQSQFVLLYLTFNLSISNIIYVEQKWDTSIIIFINA